jgi:hypothetical protein
MALNWQNGATIECRTFASTLNPDELRAAIALMSASVEYTRTHECVGDSAFDSFAGWVFAHPSYGPALAATLYAYTQLDVAA